MSERPKARRIVPGEPRRTDDGNHVPGLVSFEPKWQRHRESPADIDRKLQFLFRDPPAPRDRPERTREIADVDLHRRIGRAPRDD